MPKSKENSNSQQMSLFVAYFAEESKCVDAPSTGIGMLSASDSIQEEAQKAEVRDLVAVRRERITAKILRDFYLYRVPAE